VGLTKVAYCPNGIAARPMRGGGGRPDLGGSSRVGRHSSRGAMETGCFSGSVADSESAEAERRELDRYSEGRYASRIRRSGAYRLAD